MNLVEQIARMIDAEGAYSTWMDGMGEYAKPHPLTARQKYFQAHYECKAIELLKLFAGVDPETARRDLVEWEMDGWRRLGVPIDDMPDGRSTVERKYDATGGSVTEAKEAKFAD